MSRLKIGWIDVALDIWPAHEELRVSATSSLKGLDFGFKEELGLGECLVVFSERRRPRYRDCGGKSGHEVFWQNSKKSIPT